MTANQYRALLGCLGLTQTRAAKLLNVKPRTSRRWAQYGVDGSAAIVLWLLASDKITVDDIEAVAAKHKAG